MNKIVLCVVVACAVLLLIALVVAIYNKQKVGRSDNPTAQKAALTLLETIPIKGWAPKTGYSREQFGVPDVTSHSLRKSVATLIDDEGLSARIGADHLGHARVSETQDTYMARGRSHKAVAELLDKAISDE
jgi:integrase